MCVYIYVCIIQEQEHTFLDHLDIGSLESCPHLDQLSSLKISLLIRAS